MPEPTDAEKRTAAWKGSIGESLTNLLGGPGGTTPANPQSLNYGVGDPTTLPGAGPAAAQPAVADGGVPSWDAPPAAAPDASSTADASPAAPAQSPSQAAPQTSGGPAKPGALEAATKAETSAIGQQAQAETAQSQKLAGIEGGSFDAAQKQLADAQAERDRVNSDYQTQMQQHLADLDQLRNTHIDPNHYWQEKGTGGRILGALASAFGAFGAHMGGGENLPAKMIQDGITRDIEAQKENWERLKGTTEAKRTAYGQLREAGNSDAEARTKTAMLSLDQVNRHVDNLTKFGSPELIHSAAAIKQAQLQPQMLRLKSELQTQAAGRAHENEVTRGLRLQNQMTANQAAHPEQYANPEQVAVVTTPNGPRRVVLQQGLNAGQYAEKRNSMFEHMQTLQRAKDFITKNGGLTTAQLDPTARAQGRELSDNLHTSFLQALNSKNPKAARANARIAEDKYPSSELGILPGRRASVDAEIQSLTNEMQQLDKAHGVGGR